jgi:hypothetical protein
MHDAHEAVLGDVPSPVKEAMGALGFDFSDLEGRHERAVESRFAVNCHAPAVRAMDQAMCVAEALQGLGPLRGNGWPDCAPADTHIRLWGAEQAEHELLAWCGRLGIR